MSRVQRCHCLPLKVLYSRALENPANAPMSTNSSSMPGMIVVGERRWIRGGEEG